MRVSGTDDTKGRLLWRQPQLECPCLGWIKGRLGFIELGNDNLGLRETLRVHIGKGKVSQQMLVGCELSALETHAPLVN